jgi:nitrite reductase/ring-hydroxylating ferredoxin subunit
MDRKEFLKVCGGTCVGLLGISILHQGCTATHVVQAIHTEDGLTVAKDEFKIIKKTSESFRRYIVVRSVRSDFPVIVYRSVDAKYNAMLMQCTHQGAELNASGDILTCAAHGSEFSNKGEVIQGPADKTLRSFNIREDEKNIYIRLV